MTLGDAFDIAIAKAFDLHSRFILDRCNRHRSGEPQRRCDCTAPSVILREGEAPPNRAGQQLRLARQEPRPPVAVLRSLRG